MATEMHVQHTHEEPIYVDHHDPEAMHERLDARQIITEFIKKHRCA